MSDGALEPAPARRMSLVLFVLLWATYAYFYQSAQHNEAARFDQIRSLLEDGTVAIDRFAYNTADVVVVERGGIRHVYPAKAPGTALFGLAPFWLVSRALAPFALAPALHWHLVAYLTTILTIGLLSAASAAVLFRLIMSMTGDARASLLAVLAVWLGSIAFPFSTVFFSHQQVAALLVFAFAILYRLRRTDRAASPWRRAAAVALAGFLIGFAVTSEYPAALAGALLATYFAFLLWQFVRPLRTTAALGAAFAAGIGLGLVPLVAYNQAAFGRLFYTPYHELGAGGGSQLFRTHAQGLVGVSWPGLDPFLEVLAQITVRPQRGLLYLGIQDGAVLACSPVLWLAVPGLAVLAFRRGLRAEAALCGALIAAYLTFNACYGDSIVFWGGGASVGPRHVVTMLPFAAIPLAFIVRRLALLFYPLLMLSVFYMLLATAVEPRTPYRPVNAWSGLYLPAYFEGRFATADDGLFHPRERVTANSTAFNLAKLAGVPGAWQLAPLMLLWFSLGASLVGTLVRSEPRKAATGGRAAVLDISALAAYTALVGLAPVVTGTPRAPLGERRTATTMEVGLLGPHATADDEGQARRCSIVRL